MFWNGPVRAQIIQKPVQWLCTEEHFVIWQIWCKEEGNKIAESGCANPHLNHRVLYYTQKII